MRKILFFKYMVWVKIKFRAIISSIKYVDVDGNYCWYCYMLYITQFGSRVCYNKPEVYIICSTVRWLEGSISVIMFHYVKNWYCECLVYYILNFSSRSKPNFVIDTKYNFMSWCRNQLSYNLLIQILKIWNLTFVTGTFIFICLFTLEDWPSTLLVINSVHGR